MAGLGAQRLESTSKHQSALNRGKICVRHVYTLWSESYDRMYAWEERSDLHLKDKFWCSASRDLTSASRPHKYFSSLTFPSFYSLKTPVTAEAATLPTALILSLLPWPTRGTPFGPGEHPLFEGPESSGSGAEIVKHLWNLPLGGKSLRLA